MYVIIQYNLQQFLIEISLTRRVSLVEKELLTLPEHPSSSPIFSGVRVTRSLVVYVCFVDRCLSFSTFSFDHCVVCSSSIYGYWLLRWYLQTLLVMNCAQWWYISRREFPTIFIIQEYCFSYDNLHYIHRTWHCHTYIIKWTTQHTTVGTVPKVNTNIVERGKIDALFQNMSWI